MDLRIIIRGVEQDAELRRYAEDKITKGLARFEKYILDAMVRLQDETGMAKGGVDKACSIEVKLRRGEVRIKEQGDDFVSTIHAALDRCKAALSREAAKAKRGQARR